MPGGEKESGAKKRESWVVERIFVSLDLKISRQASGWVKYCADRKTIEKELQKERQETKNVDHQLVLRHNGGVPPEETLSVAWVVWL